MKRLPLCCLCLLLAGCDGMVGIEGWVVKSEKNGDVVLLDERPTGVPEGAVAVVTVELWTADGKRLLSQDSSESGYFSVSYIGLYQPDMEYRVKASAPGFTSISEKVRLKPGKGSWARIELPARAADTN